MTLVDASLDRVINGKYRLVAFLNQGAMGVVYRAEQLDTEGHPQRKVALKTIKHDYEQAAESAQRFLREVRVAMQLHSPHIVTVHDSGRDEEGHLYYVMELMQGPTLKALLREQNPLPVARAVNIAGQICEGLAEAHGLPEAVIHRDLKPANIFVEQQLGQDWVKIADFGIAKVLGEETVELTSAGIVGTPHYMAPEQWQGGKKVDGRTDLYALGVVLYEMLSGRVPFLADDMATLMYKHLVQIPPPLPATVPAALSSLVMQLLAKDPAERPRDALTVRQVLGGRDLAPAAEVPQSEEGQSADDLTIPTRVLPQTSESRRRKIIGWGVLVLVLFGGGLWSRGLFQRVFFSRETATVRQYRLAAEQGNAVAQFNLGVLYAEGRGVARNVPEAMRWYRKAAEQGYANAQNNLGTVYTWGGDSPPDFLEAARWYRKAAEQGSAEAQNNLGLLYAQGKGVPADLTEAARWYRKAAEQGYREAQYNLGKLYLTGQIEGHPNYAQAAYWYQRAAEQGYVLAQFDLGGLYAQGKGVPADMTEAARWYRKAAEQGNADARVQLKKILGMDASAP